MVFVTLAFYFLLMVALAALALLPAVRGRAVDIARRAVRYVANQAGGARRRSGSAIRGAGSSVRERCASALRFVVTHRVLWLGASLVVLLPVLIGLAFGGRYVAFFDDESPRIDRKVAALLNGEHLAPPQPLPPEVFATAEVEMVRPLTKEGSRDWGVLDVDFRDRLLLVYKIMKERHGYDLALLEGYRSPERQARLAALGSQVTRAGANKSYHQYGLAADNAFYRDGRLIISERDPWAMQGYQLYGEVAESVGLVWGGRWSFKDYGHVEYHKPGMKIPSASD